MGYKQTMRRNGIKKNKLPKNKSIDGKVISNRTCDRTKNNGKNKKIKGANRLIDKWNKNKASLTIQRAWSNKEQRQLARTLRLMVFQNEEFTPFDLKVLLIAYYKNMVTISIDNGRLRVDKKFGSAWK